MATIHALTGTRIRMNSGAFSRTGVMAAAAACGLNFAALRLGDKYGDGRQAVGASNAITQEAIGLCLEEFDTSSGMMPTRAGLDRLITEATDGRWNFDDYARPTIRKPGRRSTISKAPAPAPAPAPTPTAPVIEEVDEVSPGTEGAAIDLDRDLAASREEARVLTATVEDLRSRLEEAEGSGEPDPLEGIKFTAAELSDSLSTYLPPKELVQLVERVKATKKANPRRIRRLFDFSGPAGGGKTLGAMYVAAELGWSLVKIDCGLVEDSGKGFLVEQGTANGSLTEELSRFAKAIVCPRTVVILDELPRAPLTAQNGLLPLFDGGMATQFSYTTGETVRIERHPDTVTIMARNDGREYIGSGNVDAALLNRAEKVLIEPPSPSTVRSILNKTGCPKSSIGKLVKVYTIVTSIKMALEAQTNLDLLKMPPEVIELSQEIGRIPSESVSLRGLESVACSIAAGVDEQEAFTVGLYRHMSVESRKGDPVVVIAAQVGHAGTQAIWSRSQVATGMKG